MISSLFLFSHLLVLYLSIPGCHYFLHTGTSKATDWQWFIQPTRLWCIKYKNFDIKATQSYHVHVRQRQNDDDDQWLGRPLASSRGFEPRAKSRHRVFGNNTSQCSICLSPFDVDQCLRLLMCRCPAKWPQAKDFLNYVTLNTINQFDTMTPSFRSFTKVYSNEKWYKSTFNDIHLKSFHRLITSICTLTQFAEAGWPS